MLTINFTGNLRVDLSILFGLLTLGVGVLVGIMYLVFSRMIREPDDSSREPPSDPGRDGPTT